MDRRSFLENASLLAGVVLLGRPAASEASNTRSLAGPWQFRADPNGVGEAQRWHEQLLSEVISLPASTDEAGYGTETSGPACGHLSRAHRYVGVCWYQKEVVIPKAWQGRHVRLFLERCLWETRLWMNGRALGRRDSLCTPHRYDLGVLSPGRCRLTLRVSNAPIVNLGDYGHSYTEHTQSKWNGVVGRLELQATDPVWIDQVQVYPDAAARTVRLEGLLRNVTGAAVSAQVEATVSPLEEDGRRSTRRASTTLKAAGAEAAFQLNLPLRERVALWDELDPALYQAEVQLRAGAHRHQVAERFGLRAVSTRDRRVTLNGRPVTLRGTLECCIFPKTGYPPTDVDAWRRLYRIARSYGLNHFRFHSWCPPEAAFVAADEAGFILQVETPLWYDFWMSERPLLTCDFTENDEWLKPTPFGEDPAVVQFIRDEMARVLEAYGNHPSFCMMCIGNEIGGDYELINTLIQEAKAKDPRRLYSGSTAREHVPADDFYVTHATEEGVVRGIQGTGTEGDFRAARDAVAVPVVSHEIGQHVVHPDYGELEKYTGPLKPRNLEHFRSKLAASGLLDQAEDLQRASGRFAWKLYKEEIEAALRTPLAGFQLLQLQDFPGQGEALVGLLDAFWEEKGLLTPEEMRRFCGETVPLLRTEKFVWENHETFEAAAQYHHAGRAAMEGAVGWWRLQRGGEELASGRFEPASLPLGETTTLGTITVPLEAVREARHVKVMLGLEGTEIENDWDLWVYPSEDRLRSGGVVVTERWEEAASALEAGEDVLLLAAAGETGDRAVETRFMPVFWSFAMFEEQPGTLGLRCDPEHPALAQFPTAFHSNWQWRDVMEGGRAFVFDEEPDVPLLVQVIDDFHRAHRLGAVFEARVGGGQLVVCGFDLQQDLGARPAARQLRRSLLAYMNTASFNPEVALEAESLRTLMA